MMIFLSQNILIILLILKNFDKQIRLRKLTAKRCGVCAVG